MKKIIATLVALTVALSLASCGGDEGTTSSTGGTSSKPTSSTPTSSVPSVDSPSSEVSSEPEVETKNLAIKGTAIADGNHAEYADGIDALNDGNTLTRWQSADKIEDEDNVSWFGIQWDEAQTFDTITALWEAAHPLEDGFRVEISDDGETWTAAEFTAVRTGTMNEDLGILESDKQMDTITMAEVTTAKAVRIVCFTHYTVPEGLENAGNTKSPTSCYEMEIYNSADLVEDTVSSENASDTVSE